MGHLVCKQALPTLVLKNDFVFFSNFCLYGRQSMAPSVVGSLNEKDEKAKKAKQPIVIWPEWTEQDIAQEKWV